MSFLGLDKWSRLFRIIRQSGGVINACYKMWRFDTLKEGSFVGSDSFGNKYYENNYYMIGRNRWVEYNPNFKWDYEGSQVTSEWFGWLHHKTDNRPCEDCAKYCLYCCCYVKSWMLPFAENLTGTDQAYYPYSTSRSHISVWDVPKGHKRYGRKGYVRNFKFHCDSMVGTIGFYDTAQIHRNPHEAAAVQYTPSVISKIKGSSHTLL